MFACLKLEEQLELEEGEQQCLEQWLNDAKFTLVLKPTTMKEAVQRILCYYVFDSRMSQLQALAVRIS